jgi:PAS domain S-box-containing protein
MREIAFHLPVSFIVWSVALVFFTCHIAMFMANHSRQADENHRKFWMAASAIVQGSGIWGMNFISMMGIESVVPASYNISMGFISLIFPVFTSYIFMLIVCTYIPDTKNIVIASTIRTITISSVNLPGLSALQINGIISFDSPWLVLSIVFGFIISYTGLKVWHRSADVGFTRWVASSILFAASVCVMHYMTIRSTRIHFNGLGVEQTGQGSRLLIMMVGGIILMLALVMAWIAISDKISQTRIRAVTDKLLGDLFNNSMNGQILFDAVAPHKVIMINRRGRHILGLNDDEYSGKSLVHIVPVESGGIFESQREASGRRGYYEVAMQTITLHGKQRGLAQLCDITESKRKELLCQQEASLYADILNEVPVCQLISKINSFVRDQIDAASVVMLLDPERQTLHAFGPSELPQHFLNGIDGLMAAEGEASCGTSVYRGETVIASHISEDPLWEKYRDLAAEHRLQACVSRPILSGGKLIGSFAVYYFEPCCPAPFDLQVMERMGNIIRLALSFEDKNMNSRLPALENEQRYKSLFMYHPGAVYIFDREGFFKDGNRSGEIVTGYSIDELRHQPFHFLLREPSLTLTLNYFKKAAAGIPQTYETQLIRKDGSTVYLSVTNVPIVINEEVVGVFGISHDITSRVMAVNELKHARSVLEETLNGYDGFIFKLGRENENYLCTMCAGRWLELYGFNPQDIVGKEFVIFPEFRSRMDQVWLTGEKQVFCSEMFRTPILVVIRPEHQKGQVTQAVLFIMEHPSGESLESALNDAGTPGFISKLLTKREKEVAALIAEEKSNREIAEYLEISENTVKNHIANIFSKLNITDRIQLAEMMRREFAQDLYQLPPLSSIPSSK